MTPTTDESKNSFPNQQLESGDWDVMFCAVLARLGSAIESMDQNVPQRNCLPECMESLHMLRQAALQYWAPTDQTVSLKGSNVLAPTEQTVQTRDGAVRREQP